jgi:Flp pilus assembly secretin CpaC
VAEFRTALELDAANPFAQQRLTDALGDAAPQLSQRLRLVERSDPVELQPRPGPADFHYRGDARGLYEMIAHSFGLKASFDTSFTSRQVRFEVEGVDFFKAMELAGMVSKSFWVPLAENEFLVAPDTAENHRQLDRMSLRSFYVSQASTPQELNDIAGMLRGVFDIRLVSVNASKNLLTVRAPRQTLDAATDFLNQLSTTGPQQVLLDVQVFEIDRMLLRNLGISLPLQYQMFSLAGVASLLSNANIQQLINQLIASGGINAANSSALQALLAQLQQQQLNPLLTTPFATFGGGITLFGVTIPPAVASFQFNSSTVKSLQHVTLRAMQGKAANMLVGSRYPILNATFAPIYNTPAIAQSVQNNTFIPAFPSVSYEDLGLIMKTTPSIHGESDVTLDVEAALRSLTGQSLNGVPVISNRTYKSSITVKNGETAVVVGDINHSEQLSLGGGLPGLGSVPGLGLLFATQNKNNEDDEFLLVITPHILDAPAGETHAVWLPPGR